MNIINVYKVSVETQRAAGPDRLTLETNLPGPGAQLQMTAPRGEGVSYAQAHWDVPVVEYNTQTGETILHEDLLVRLFDGREARVTWGEYELPFLNASMSPVEALDIVAAWVRKIAATLPEYEEGDMITAFVSRNGSEWCHRVIVL